MSTLFVARRETHRHGDTEVASKAYDTEEHSSGADITANPLGVEDAMPSNVWESREGYEDADADAWTGGVSQKRVGGCCYESVMLESMMRGGCGSWRGNRNYVPTGIPPFLLVHAHSWGKSRDLALKAGINLETSSLVLHELVVIIIPIILHSSKHDNFHCSSSRRHLYSAESLLTFMKPTGAQPFSPAADSWQAVTTTSALRNFNDSALAPQHRIMSVVLSSILARPFRIGVSASDPIGCRLLTEVQDIEPGLWLTRSANDIPQSAMLSRVSEELVWDKVKPL
ncbi:hypothetical protein AJ80_02370 [Polytolypa hystricis UAMH7299]|uniref:Uncharacterized protein n=1 Tax=Polytolypa hystricis (strain UAMH7299) TaxID=1447883 RepID=A0A2B7YQZ1_POLH7|nr:hypothetical protein AJ80_02370 [Polytolypa hystricis UAMH7299]